MRCMAGNQIRHKKVLFYWNEKFKPRSESNKLYHMLI